MTVARVRVGQLDIVDGSREEVVREMVRLHMISRHATLLFAAHVSALALKSETDAANAYGKADLIYADGISVVVLAKAAGASGIESAPTTDIGVPFLKSLSRNLGRPVNVALAGGPPGLAERAGAVLEGPNVRVVSCEDGYLTDFGDAFARLGRSGADVLLLGLGSPLEQIVGAKFSHLLRPDQSIVTVGGWFKFLAGDEKRSPKFMIALKCEWLWRLAQDPRRLAARYVFGLADVLRMLLRIWWARFRRVLRNASCWNGG